MSAPKKKAQNTKYSSITLFRLFLVNPGQLTTSEYICKFNTEGIDIFSAFKNLSNFWGLLHYSVLSVSNTSLKFIFTVLNKTNWCFNQEFLGVRSYSYLPHFCSAKRKKKSVLMFYFYILCWEIPFIPLSVVLPTKAGVANVTALTPVKAEQAFPSSMNQRWPL